MAHEEMHASQSLSGQIRDVDKKKRKTQNEAET